jgi:hypothetical protein
MNPDSNGVLLTILSARPPIGIVELGRDKNYAYPSCTGRLRPRLVPAPQPLVFAQRCRDLAVDRDQQQYYPHRSLVWQRMKWQRMQQPAKV